MVDATNTGSNLWSKVYLEGGKMGSLVGASEEVKRTGGVDSSLNEYAVCFLFIAPDIPGNLIFVPALEPRLNQWHHCPGGRLRFAITSPITNGSVRLTTNS